MPPQVTVTLYCCQILQTQRCPAKWHFLWRPSLNIWSSATGAGGHNKSQVIPIQHLRTMFKSLKTHWTPIALILLNIFQTLQSVLYSKTGDHGCGAMPWKATGGVSLQGVFPRRHNLTSKTPSHCCEPFWKFWNFWKNPRVSTSEGYLPQSR